MGHILGENGQQILVTTFLPLVCVNFVMALHRTQTDDTLETVVDSICSQNSEHNFVDDFVLRKIF